VSTYTDALGYRARQAVLKRDFAAFEQLMTEAAETLPTHPRDNPKRTVLTHFLDFGGDPRFYEVIDRWKDNGWVSENMDCAIERARYRGTVDSDPEEAERAANSCVSLARAAADDPERRWVLDACLEDAPFLTRTSTVAIARFIEAAADPSEPFLLRAALLDGMTHVFLQDAATRITNDPKISKPVAVTDSKKQLDETERRFIAIVRAVQPNTEAGILSGSTTFGALELERVSLTHGRSLIGAFATADSPDDNDLAWGWVRAMKVKKRSARMESMGLWNRKREPAGDAYWYVCANDEGAKRDAVAILAERSVGDVEELRIKECATSSGAPPLPLIFGPYPLEVSARMAVTSSTSAPLVVKVRKKAKI
jgi:hypothetical protein